MELSTCNMSVCRDYYKLAATVVREFKPVDVLQYYGMVIEVMHRYSNNILHYNSHDSRHLRNKTHILIDLGNIHNVLQILDNTASRNFSVVAFADKCYNGYGISPAAKTARVVVATECSRNAADVHIIAFVMKICLDSGNSDDIHIVSKDKGFMELAHIAGIHGNSLSFHTDGKQLFESIGLHA